MAEADSKLEDDVTAPAHKIVDTDTKNKLPSKESDDVKEECDFEKLLSSDAITKWEEIGNHLANICVNFINLGILNTCLIYALASTHNASVRLHVVCCILGFQLCMNQGTLILSKYNTWTKNFSDQTKKQVQWYLQAVGSVLVCGGSIIIVFDQRANTYTSHGIFGIFAWAAYLMGFVNDRIVMTLYIMFPNLKSKVYIFLVKFSHYVSRIATVVFYCVCLHCGFKTDEFRYWADEREIQILIVAAYLVTAYVIIEFFNTSIGNVTDIFEDDFVDEIYEDDDSDIYIPQDF